MSVYCFLYVFCTAIAENLKEEYPLYIGKIYYIYVCLLFSVQILSFFYSLSVSMFLVFIHDRKQKTGFFHNFTKENVSIVGEYGNWVFCKPVPENLTVNSKTSTFPRFLMGVFCHG